MKWFLNISDQILGPYSADQVLADLKKGAVPYSAYVWAKGQIEWLPISEWEDNFDKLTQADPDVRPEQLWKIKSGRRVEERMKMEAVLTFLDKMENLKNVLLSPQDENEWVPVYSSYMFMEALNLSRRNFLRAPLMGLAKVTRANSRFSYVVKTATIGQGGLGVYGLGSNFEIGTLVQLKIESENINAPLNVQGKIVYNTPRGFVGISIENISAEARALILGYIKRFRESGEADESYRAS